MLFQVTSWQLVTDKEKLLKAWDIAEKLKTEEQPIGWTGWIDIYIEWFNSALHKIENNQTVPRFTLAAAQVLIEMENQK